MYKMREIPAGSNPLTPRPRSINILGHHSVAEAIVEWSKRQKKGTTHTRLTPWGLGISALADEQTPFVFVSVNVAQVARFLADWGPTSCIWVEAYGFALCGPLTGGEVARSQETPVALMHATDGAPEGEKVLYQHIPGTTPAEGLFLLGGISLDLEGPTWYNYEDLEQGSPELIKAFESSGLQAPLPVTVATAAAAAAPTTETTPTPLPQPELADDEELEELYIDDEEDFGV